MSELRAKPSHGAKLIILNNFQKVVDIIKVVLIIVNVSIKKLDESRHNKFKE